MQNHLEPAHGAGRAQLFKTDHLASLVPLTLSYLHASLENTLPVDATQRFLFKLRVKEPGGRWQAGFFCFT